MKTGQMATYSHDTVTMLRYSADASVLHVTVRSPRRNSTGVVVPSSKLRQSHAEKIVEETLEQKQYVMNRTIGRVSSIT